MLHHPASRRTLALTLIGVGALLLWLAPETPAGLLLLILAVAIELLGIALQAQARRRGTSPPGPSGPPENERT